MTRGRIVVWPVSAASELPSGSNMPGGSVCRADDDASFAAVVEPVVRAEDGRGAK